MRAHHPAASPGVNVVPLPGKGLGTVATRNYGRGEILLAERPLVKRNEDVRTGQTHEYGGNREDALKKLLTLCQASKGKDAVERCMKANSFVIQDEGTYTRFPLRWTRLAFLNISRVNHSCLPNSEFTYHAAHATATVRALRPIAPGEEVSINYGAEGTLSERQTFLSRSFEFDCRCERCVEEMGRQQMEVQRVGVEQGRAEAGSSSSTVRRGLEQRLEYIMRQKETNKQNRDRRAGNKWNR